ncbi:MAG: hypothetical protein ABIC68_02935 [Candidatus Omnitrophota bacterium]
MSRVKFFLVSVLFFFVVLPLVVFAVDSPEDLYQLALKDYKSGHFNEALREFSMVLLYWPDDQQVKFYINEIRRKDLPVRNNKIEEALDTTEDAVEAYAAVKKDSVQRQLNIGEFDKAGQK